MARKVLIVDDSKMARKIIKQSVARLLGADVIEIEEASGGEEALALCRENRYLLVLLDLTMPDFSGYDLLKTIRDEKIEQRIVVLSADIQPGAKSEVLELGAVGFLEKPFEMETARELLAEIGVI